MTSSRRLLVAVLFFAASATALAFLILPLAALLTDRPPSSLFDQLSNPVVTDAPAVSRTSVSRRTWSGGE